MLIGHFAVGLAARRVAPKAPMALLLAAPMLLDLVLPLLFFAGIERFHVDPSEQGFLVLKLEHVPWTHGLLPSIGWALLLAVPYFLVRRDGRGAVVLFALVLSHWVLDFVTHTPDLPLTWWGAERFGLGLWRSSGATLLVEGTLFVACVYAYVRTTSPKDRSGAVALWSLVALLSVIYVANVFGPPPPNGAAVAWAALAAWVSIPWGMWLDARRVTHAAPTGEQPQLAP